MSVTKMEKQVIDNFLSEEEYNTIRNLIYFNADFPFYFQYSVAEDVLSDRIWDWYGTHIFYSNDQPLSGCFEDVRRIFLPKFKDMFGGFKSLIRIKANFYPNTPVIQEHDSHVDFPWSHHGAIFSLNTCDGFTRFEDGSKVDSVGNRLLLFDPSVPHNSSTTTDQRARVNINFNWL